MKKNFLLFFLLTVFISDFLSQDNPKDKKKITFGIIPYELLGRKSSALLLFEGDKKSVGFGASYIYRTEFDGTYLFPYMKDWFFYKGFQGDFLIGKSTSENTTNYFVAGLHYLYYDYASVTNGKVGDEVGSKRYENGIKCGIHLGYYYLLNLTKRGNVRFFFRTSLYYSKYERTYTGDYYSKFSIPPQYQKEPQFQSGFSGEISVSLGLFFGVNLRK